MKKGIIALICMILTLVFIIVALVGVWYNFSIEGSGVKVNADAYLTKGVVTSNTPLVPEGTTNYDKSTSDKYIYDNTMYITIVALITGILSLIGLLGLVLKFGKPNTMKMLAVIFCILTLILCIVAALYFMTAIPAKMADTGMGVEKPGFFYSKTIEGVKIAMGPGYAWYLMIVAFITSLIATILVFMDKKVAVAAPPQ